jgi:transposase-like protein
MSDDYQRIELITGTARRRYWSTEQKLRIIEQSFEPGETVSSVARRHGVAANLLYRWRRLMSEGGATAVGSDEPVVGSSEVRNRGAGARAGAPARPQDYGELTSEIASRRFFIRSLIRFALNSRSPVPVLSGILCVGP